MDTRFPNRLKRLAVEFAALGLLIVVLARTFPYRELDIWPAVYLLFVATCGCFAWANWLERRYVLLVATLYCLSTLFSSVVWPWS